MGKKNPSTADIVDYAKPDIFNLRSAAFFLVGSKFTEFTRIYTALKSNRSLEHDDVTTMGVYMSKFSASEANFLSKVLPCFPLGTRPPSIQNRINFQYKARRTLTKDEVWDSLPDSLHKTELDEKTALESLNKVLPNIQKKIDETEILIWNKLENVRSLTSFLCPTEFGTVYSTRSTK